MLRLADGQPPNCLPGSRGVRADVLALRLRRRVEGAGEARRSPGRSASAPAQVQWSGIFEIIEVKLRADGSVAETPQQRSRVAAEGTGIAVIAVPVSSPRARRVGLGRAPVVNGSAQVRMNLKGNKEATIVSDFTKPLPVKVTPTYELDGKPTTAGALRGKSGTVKVTLKLANVTEQQTTVSFMGFNDVPQKMTVTAPQPILASLSLVLPGNASDVSAPGASLSPSRTGLSVGWTPLLFGPAGTTQSFSYQMTTKRASIPVTSLYVWTLGPYQTPTGRATKASAQAVAAAQAQATKSLAAIHASLTKLSQLQASLVAKATKSQNADSRARTSSDTATLNALEQKLHGASGKLANAEAEADAGIAEINAIASSVSIKGVVQARAAADLARASAKLAAADRESRRHARVPTSPRHAHCVTRADALAAEIGSLPSAVQSLPEFAQLHSDVSCPAEPSDGRRSLRARRTQPRPNSGPGGAQPQVQRASTFDEPGRRLGHRESDRRARERAPARGPAPRQLGRRTAAAAISQMESIAAALSKQRAAQARAADSLAQDIGNPQWRRGGAPRGHASGPGASRGPVREEQAVCGPRSLPGIGHSPARVREAVYGRERGATARCRQGGGKRARQSAAPRRPPRPQAISARASGDSPVGYTPWRRWRRAGKRRSSARHSSRRSKPLPGLDHPVPQTREEERPRARQCVRESLAGPQRGRTRPGKPPRPAGKARCRRRSMPPRRSWQQPRRRSMRTRRRRSRRPTPRPRPQSPPRRRRPRAPSRRLKRTSTRPTRHTRSCSRSTRSPGSTSCPAGTPRESTPRADGSTTRSRAPDLHVRAAPEGADMNDSAQTEKKGRIDRKEG